MGEEGANVLLMGFIQAWRLQARPPHGRVGVNSPPPPSSRLPTSLTNCYHSSEVERESASATEHLPSMLLIHDASQATVL